MKNFLFSIDLEDPRALIQDGFKYNDTLVQVTNNILDWLKANNFLCTFFVTGDILKRYPCLINNIIGSGHEIACHTYSHKSLQELGPDGLKNDLEAFFEILKKYNITNAEGFRAPYLSFTNDTIWAYEILEKFKFKYSSSVLPGSSPLYSWVDYENMKFNLKNIKEYPVSVVKFFKKKLPVFGGIYFRVLPFWLFKLILKKERDTIISYFHPYDFDLNQDYFMFHGINNSLFFNSLMYYNRKSMFKKLDYMIENGYKIKRFIDLK